jgi:primosomal replication protein N
MPLIPRQCRGEGVNMIEKILKNNQAVIAGEIISDFEFNHEVFGEGFYFVKLKVSRLSHSSDIIPLLVSERLIDVKQSHIGQFLEARGQFRSHNKQESDKNRVVLFLFAKEIEMIDSAENRNPNEIFLDGYICKEPVYRTTPLGREIADVLLAVNRAYGKSDYIPCICWGRNARYAGNLTVGSRIQLRGRIQSREYQKRIGEGKVVDKIAYEVSASQMEYIEEEE